MKIKQLKRPAKKQVDFLRIALGLSGIVCNSMACECILIAQAEMRRLGGKFSMRDGARIETMLIDIYKREEQLDVQSLKNEVEKLKRDFPNHDLKDKIDFLIDREKNLSNCIGTLQIQMKNLNP